MSAEPDEEFVYRLTRSDVHLLMFAIGAAGAMFYDGTHRHGETDNAQFRAFMAVAKKLNLPFAGKKKEFVQPNSTPEGGTQ